MGAGKVATFPSASSRRGEPPCNLIEDLVMKPLDVTQTSHQSLWLDYIRRGILASGTLDEYIHTYGIRGLTSNPTIFDHAIAESSDYDTAIGKYDPSDGRSIEDLFFTLAIEDLQNAADRFRAI
ncbi:transaldolase, partial [mine drainage metagenome]